MRNVNIIYILAVSIAPISGCITRQEPRIDHIPIPLALPAQPSTLRPTSSQVHIDEPAMTIIVSGEEPNRAIPSIAVRPSIITYTIQKNTPLLNTVQSDKTIDATVSTHATPSNAEQEYSLDDILRDLEQLPDRPQNEIRKIKKGDQVEFLSVFDQGESKEDIRLTAVIRRALVGDESLSYQAMNIVVITRQGVVTLQGVLSNEQSRLKVLTIAERFVPKYRIISKILIGKIRDYQVSFP